jgi:hydrogenase maturation protease
MTIPSNKTVVLGLGNILHSDDGLGARAAERLKSDARLPDNITVIEGGTLGLELLPDLWDCSDLLVLDAVDVGATIGTVVRLSGEQLQRLSGSANVHQLGVADLLVALRLLARRLPRVLLLGIQPASTDWGCTLSPTVEAAIPSLIETALAELYARRDAEMVPL